MMRLMAFRSLTTRLIFWILLAAGLVFAAAFLALSRVARQTAIQAAEQEAAQASERLVNRVRGVLSAVEESAELLATTVETVDMRPSDLEALLRGYVASEEEVYGSAVAFAPGEFHGSLPGHRGPVRLFAPYAFGHGEAVGSLRVLDLADESYGYLGRDWYAGPAAAGKESWSEPYVDRGASGLTMVTYSVPFFTRAGPRRVRGVATADVPLDWLVQVVDQVKIGRTGIAVVLSRQGRILAAPRLLPSELGAPMLDQLPAERRERLAPIIQRMLEGEKGFQTLDVQGRRGRLLYEPIGKEGWSLAVFYPEDELMEGVVQLQEIQASLGLLGMLILVVVVVTLSRRLTAPLRELAGAAHRLASSLDAELPEVRSKDELGALANAFRDMRDALRGYVHDLEVTTAAKERLESELKIARRIQMDMVPRPSAGGREEGYELSALLEPARDVGGDLYDHFAEGGRVFFLVADVSGKGVPAALFMARAKTLFEATAARLVDPGAILAEVNHGLCRENESGMYVTGVCGVLETAGGELTFACAGHSPPIHLRGDGPPEPFHAEGGALLGLIEEAAFPLNRVRLAPGEGIVAYTDGVSEAFDAAGELFGDERLMRALAPVSRQEASQVTLAVREAVRDFVNGATQSDDITVLTLRYLRATRT
jgi:sigma-B regulation protein RsbU (phosphoserine phosphatase)